MTRLEVAGAVRYAENGNIEVGREDPWMVGGEGTSIDRIDMLRR